MKNIYLAFSRLDQDFADSLIMALQNAGATILYEIDDEKKRLTKMARADQVIVCLSEAILSSPRLRTEITLARTLNKELIPLTRQPCADLFPNFEETKDFLEMEVINFSGRSDAALAELFNTLGITPQLRETSTVSSIPAASKNQPTIFISYRRDDSADVTGRIYDRLITHFGDEKVIRDVDSIPLGIDFKEYLGNLVKECAVELVIIGREWLEISDSQGHRRLDDPSDFVRIEIETALQRNIPVIPILVQNASMPTAEHLPSSLTKLAYRNGTVVRRDPDFKADIDRLIKGLEPLLAQPAPNVTKPPAPDSQENSPALNKRVARPHLDSSPASLSQRRDSQEQYTSLIGHSGAVIAVACSNDGKYIVTGSADKSAIVWNVSDLRRAGVLTGHTNRITSLAISSNAQFVMTGSDDKTARIWDIETRQTLGVLVGHTANIDCVAFSPDAQIAFTGSTDGTARFWQTSIFAELYHLTGKMLQISCAAFSPDGAMLITDGFARNAILWETISSLEIRELEGHQGRITSVAFSPDGLYALTGSTDDSARLWDPETGREFQQFTGHTDDVNSVIFSPDSKYIATGSSDGTARLWDIVSGAELREFAGHSHKVLSVAFLPDGKAIVTGSADSTARVWRI